MSTWKKTKVSEFLFEREGKYKPNSEELTGLKRIEKIDFQGSTYGPGSRYWSTSPEGIYTLGRANRLVPGRKTMSYLRR